MTAGTLRAAMFLSGAALVSYGAWAVYRPAGFIVGGVILLLCAIVGHVRNAA